MRGDVLPVLDQEMLELLLCVGAVAAQLRPPRAFDRRADGGSQRRRLNPRAQRLETLLANARVRDERRILQHRLDDLVTLRGENASVISLDTMRFGATSNGGTRVTYEAEAPRRGPR